MRDSPPPSMYESDQEATGGMATVPAEPAVPGVRVSCPQCGALLTPPHQVETFTCSWCGSTLRPGEGLRLFHLVERPRFDRREADQSLRRWFAGPDMPADLEANVAADVGPLQLCPFLRARGPGVERVVPLVPLPVPDLLDLPSVPADMAASDAVADGPSTASALPGSDAVRHAILEATRDPAVKELVIEERGYYPVVYRYAGGQYTAVIAAGSGSVLAQRRPARAEVAGERFVALGVLLLLFGEAVLVPGTVTKVAAVGLTTIGLYPVLRWLAAARL